MTDEKPSIQHFLDLCKQNRKKIDSTLVRNSWKTQFNKGTNGNVKLFDL